MFFPLWKDYILFDNSVYKVLISYYSNINITILMLIRYKSNKLLMNLKYVLILSFSSCTNLLLVHS